MRAACHTGGATGLDAGARAFIGADCSTWLTETDSITHPGDCVQHMRTEGASQTKSPSGGKGECLVVGMVSRPGSEVREGLRHYFLSRRDRSRTWLPLIGQILSLFQGKE